MHATDDDSEPLGAEPAEIAGATVIDVRRAPAFDQARCLRSGISAWEAAGLPLAEKP